MRRGVICLASTLASEAGPVSTSGAAMLRLVAPPNNFDLAAFTQALETGDTTLQLAAYSDNAEVRIVDPDHSPRAPWVRRAKPAIAAWIASESAQRVTCRVTNLLAAGDRVACTELRRYRDDREEMATSILELADGLIASQQMILVWDRWD